ncbi:tRNA glutamyl-Q(34) synthetase GluQRS [Gallaecimonas sp. GXIMD4217]|uniref:tRNA glutamyl-Q(34) synthetase GluQRS n=1 Tax=Gallaecimonas sp. GXIMD4217 TaxID=3131927 RepID=UPI00311ABF62
MSAYLGRFAPSPSGPLHFGSLVAALGSFLDARANQGQWLLRIEDIDPPREMPGAAERILRTLEAFGLHWDGQVRYQSAQSERYDALLAQLRRDGLIYPCACTRRQIKVQGLHQRNHCQPVPRGEAAALRFKSDNPVYHYQDRLLGQVRIPDQLAREDFVIHRKDGLYAYQLAVVADDIDQGITQIVRGSDLLEVTGWQLSLYQALGAKPCSYLHLPLAVAANGLKLSKQNHAPAVNDDDPVPALRSALAFLGQPAPPTDLDRDRLLAFAIDNWQVQAIPRHSQVID